MAVNCVSHCDEKIPFVVSVDTRPVYNMVRGPYDIKIKEIIVLFLRFVICFRDSHCPPPKKKIKRKPSYVTDHMVLRKGSSEGRENYTVRNFIPVTKCYRWVSARPLNCRW